MSFNALIHMHGDSWAILVILFLLSVIFKKQKITLWLQRLFYIVMIVSGVAMLAKFGWPGLFIMKGILALILIGLMEMIVVRTKKQKPAAVFWILFIIILIIILLIGYQVIG
ncbi:membrane protein implicated in regulation of membrane protease activity [Scopulibacillus daqui]|uniref:Membrane protein implicated in regulation of membrane protease activity n=1 Tax=Scopulibacillus daqui TaxID=1469162 RepID=A0ABS2PVQ2_9BACL|nr:DUF1516 family protein [Scopulibacillus daqui]MBM7644127.1 membrane protein implicated in regulation of membrane protease activity [Scopulibacillus daqui]